MKRVIMVATMLAVLLSSCSIGETYLNVTTNNTVAFSVYSSGTVGTKGSITTLNNSIGVFAYDQGPDTEWSDFAAGYTYDLPNFINDYIKTSSGDSSSWVFQTNQFYYWESNNDEMYSFFAYAPYDNTYNNYNGTTEADMDMSLGTSLDNGAPTITYKVNTEDPSNAVDFMAGQSMNIYKTENDGIVEIYLKHQLTRVVFSAISGAPTTTLGADATFVNIKELEILSGSQIYKKAVYKYNTETTNNSKDDHKQDGSWTCNNSDLITENFSLSTFLNVTTENIDYTNGYQEAGVYLPTVYDISGATSSPKVSLFKDDEYIFLIPPASDTGIGSDDVKIQVKYDVVTVDSSLSDGYIVSSKDNVVTASLTEGTLRQGYAYEFVLTMGKTDDNGNGSPGYSFNQVSISATIADWNSDESNYPTTYVVLSDETSETDSNS